MKVFEEELKIILATDPLGLLDVKPKNSGLVTADARLAASFEEINDFMQTHGREPGESKDIGERKLYSRLKGLRESPEKAEALVELDTYQLLSDVKVSYLRLEPKEIKTIDDDLYDDALGLLDKEPNPADIFELKHVPNAWLAIHFGPTSAR